MTRVEVPLDDAQMAALERVAKRRGVSVAALIQQEVAHLVERPMPEVDQERRLRARAAAGRFRSGQNDLSVRHDDHFAESINE